MIVTFDGMAAWRGELHLAAPFINLWKRHNPQDEVVARVEHGTEAELVSRQGNVCKVRIAPADAAPVTGYVMFWFLKELKQEWMQKRLEGQA